MEVAGRRLVCLFGFLLVAVGLLIQLLLLAPFWKEDKGEVGYSFISVVLPFSAFQQ